jgi:hypothetical protein
VTGGCSRSRHHETGLVKAALGKIFIYIFVAWFAYVSWRAVPHFSEGFETGLQYYRIEAVQTLDDFAMAGERMLQHMKTYVDTLHFSEDVPVTGTAGRYRHL